jgi:hypothetical protein
MTREQEIREALSACLDRLLAGATVEECLRLYPSLARDLEPLLRTASTLLQTTASVSPTPEVRARVLANVLAGGQERRPRGRRGVLGWRPWMLAPLAAALLGVAVWGVSGAAAQSLPGDPLYPVKTWQERITLTLTPSPGGKARLAATLGQRRAQEAERLLARGEGGKELEALLHRMALHAHQAASYWARIPGDDPSRGPALGPGPRARPLPPGLARKEAVRQEVRRMLQEMVASQDPHWQEIVRRAPPGRRPALERAYQQWREEVYKALRSLE